MLSAQLWLMTQIQAVAQRLAQPLRRHSRGQGLVEYALIIAVVAVVAVVTLNAVGGQLKTTFQSFVTTLQNNPGATPTP